MFTLDEIQHKNWNDWVLKCYPQEAVALVVEGAVIPMHNAAENPELAFKVSVKDYWEYKDKIQAVLHSHCYKLTDRIIVDPRIPGVADMTTQVNMGCWWGISCTEGEGVSDILWFGKDRGEPYGNREFIYNVADCLELMRDFYRREFNIEVPPQPRKWDWFVDENQFEDFYKDKGFDVVDKDNLQYGDVIMFNIADTKVNHIGIYLGDDQVLHHLADRLSNVDTVSRWYRQVKFVIRHKQLMGEPDV